jgi:hypothetical protein
VRPSAAGNIPKAASSCGGGAGAGEELVGDGEADGPTAAPPGKMHLPLVWNLPRRSCEA